MIDSDTIAVVKQTWKAITALPEQQEYVGMRLLHNYLRVVPSARAFFPPTSDSLIDDESFRESASHLMMCIDKAINTLENQRHLRFKALLQTYGKKLSRLHIPPSCYTMAWFALIETLQDVLEDRFTELMLAYWIDIIDPINTIVAKGVGRHMLGC